MVTLRNVNPLIVKICRLHSFCIDCGGNTVDIIPIEDSDHITCKVSITNLQPGARKEKQVVVQPDTNVCPFYLLRFIEQFDDSPNNRRMETRYSNIPIDKMLGKLQEKNFVCSTIRLREE